MHMTDKHWKDAQQKVNSGHMGRGEMGQGRGNGGGEKTFMSKHISKDRGTLSIF